MTNVSIRLSGYALNLYDVKRVKFSSDGKIVQIVGEDGKTTYETALENVVIITKTEGEEK